MNGVFGMTSSLVQLLRPATHLGKAGEVVHRFQDSIVDDDDRVRAVALNVIVDLDTVFVGGR